MNLEAALTEIAAFLDLDAAELIAYAAEDTVGGFHFDANLAKWPGGSLWEVEGKTLFALMIALRPLFVLELGVHHGCSTTHLLSAARNISDTPVVVSIDFWEGAGSLIPSDLQPMSNLIFINALQYIPTMINRSVDFVFEDCIHSESEVYAIVEALKPKLAHGAVVVHHDSEHGDDGQQIRRALDRTGVRYKSWLIEPSDCGLAIWRAE